MIKKNSISARNVRAVKEVTQNYLKNLNRTKVKEAYGAPDSSAGEDAGWRPITGNTIDRDLSPVTQDKMQNIAVWLYDSDPIAKRIIDLKRDFIVGEPVTVHAEDEEVDKVIQEFWYDPINNMDLFLPDITRDLGLFGEQALPAFVNDKNGHVRLGYLDPCLINKIITNPDNCREQIGLTLKGVQGYNDLTTRDESFINKWRKTQGVNAYTAGDKKTYSIINLNRNVNDAKRYNRLVGDAFFFAINKVTNATRGRSDLLSLADWIHNYEQFLFNRIERARLLNCFLWDVELQGMNPDQIKKWVQTQGVPKPSSIRAHNEKVKWDTVSPKLESNDASNEAAMFRSHIAGGAGIPVHWLGGGEGLTRATALEMSTPVFKHLKQRQLYIKYIVNSMLDFVIDQAIIAGRLKPDVNREVHVMFPALSSKDLIMLSNALTGISNSLVVAKDAGLITPDEASTHLRLILNLLGGEFDPSGSDVMAGEQEGNGGAGMVKDPGVDMGMQESIKLYNKIRRK